MDAIWCLVPLVILAILVLYLAWLSTGTGDE